MPTDLQLIDGFEQLRECFVGDNPASLLEPPSPSPASSARDWVVEAWIQAMESRTASDGAARCRVPSLARVILSQEPEREETGALPPADRRMIEHGRQLPDRLEQAARRRLWPINSGPSERSLTEEAAIWDALLPGLSSLRPWRLLALLGRPAVVPQAHVRRFLWRLGLLERRDSTRAALRQTASLVERIVGLTGLAAPGLAVLIDWHAGADRKLAGGGWGGQHP